MKKFIPLLLFTLLIIPKSGFAADHPSNCTVYVASDSKDLGLVSIKHSKFKNGTSIFGVVLGGDGDAGKDTDPTYPDDYGDSKYDEYTFIAGSSATCAYYVYAKANVGCEFSYWSETENGEPLDLKAEDKYSWTHYAGTHSKKLYAHFKKIGYIETEVNNNAGYITLSNDDAVAGEVITAKVTLRAVDKNINMMSYFSHWEILNPETREVLETYTEDEISFEVKPMILRAVFASKGANPGDENQKFEKGKYYRVRNAYNRVLSLEGSFDAKLSTSNLDVPTSLLRWALPFDYDASSFNAGSGWELSDAYKPIWPEATPSTIFYLEDCQSSGDNFTNIVLTGQDVNTYSITGYKFDLVPSESFYGYFTIDATVSGQKVRFKAFSRDGYGIVNVSTPNNDAMVAMAAQPIDAEHIDDFWFGAYATSDAANEGGYWTSMYTAFPYELYDPGVEAYYIKKQQAQNINGDTYLMLEKIEDGIVPAFTAVLLKCNEPENTKANRMLPLDPSTVTKTIDDNLLEGVFQLNEYKEGDRNYRDTRLYSNDNIRVLGVNKNGQVGLFKMSDHTLLAANKAYLDISKLETEINTMSIRFSTMRDTATGIEGIVFDKEQNVDSDVIYDLYGRRVTNPVSGNFYIINGKKVIWK